MSYNKAEQYNLLADVASVTNKVKADFIREAEEKTAELKSIQLAKEREAMASLPMNDNNVRYGAIGGGWQKCEVAA